MLRILFIKDRIGPGGASKLLRELLPRFKQQGHYVEVLFLTTIDEKGFMAELGNLGVVVNHINSNKPYSPLNIFSIKNHLKHGHYHIVHCHLFPTSYWVSFAVKLLRKKPKVVFTEHSTHNKRRDLWYFKYIDKFIYKSFDSIISISQKTQDILLKWLNEDSDRFTVVENGININKFKNSIPYNKSEINQTFNDTTKLICMAGRFKAPKDQRTVIEAMSDLPTNSHLILLGEGPLRTEYEDLVKNLSLEGRVHFLGFRNDIERIFKTVDIIVLSSYWEGFGLVAAEGMASGKPVVVSNVDGLREVVQNGGVLVEKGNSTELSDVLKVLISNKQYYSVISKKCLQRSKRYDIEVMVAKYLEIYSNLNAFQESFMWTSR
ncbi:glycosyltransferase family 4 protein [Chitinispirillales bacterium ANBcel5]|uniref:glycosyltransferase family 4 protein n=1 Tax=Cellulosispirillum alkaliphilum TaxID=3039283 RepID=UPI002A4F532B|nr:glycosyltransferase family 4 protein [Chitinispirillales bacterium ANBcel5]